MRALSSPHSSAPLTRARPYARTALLHGWRSHTTQQAHAAQKDMLMGDSSAQRQAPQHELTLNLYPAPQTPPPPAVAEPRQQSPRLQLAYHTGWEAPVLHHCVGGGEWKVVEMKKVVSGGLWKSAVLDVPPHAGSSANGGAPDAAHPPLLEFVIGSGHEEWDKAPDGGNYTVTQQGSWVLVDGQLSAAPSPPVLLVSDLDDTMIGDDAATAAFTKWWQEEAVPAGGRLVYNTGRALDLFVALLAMKGHVMAEPDMLVSAIGTRIYYKGPDGGWTEDAAYTASLGRGWELEGVREACYRALANVGKDAMHFRPPSEMSEHKVTCGVRLDVLEGVVASITADLAAASVAHRIVVSGSGDWRFVDLVPREAGKLQALEYARRTLGFSPEQTVAAGDSGNDLDMLEGQHRAIVVGNAHPELMAWAQKRSSVVTPDALHVASATRAHGILEGLTKWGFKAPPKPAVGSK